MMPKALLVDREKQKELDTRGFTTIRILDERKLNLLREFYNNMHPEGAPEKIEGIHMTTWCSNYSYKRKVSDFLQEIYKEPCKKLFSDFRVLNNVFIVKDSGETPFKVHQDWNVVDENENFAINVWVPLYDVSAKEGGLWVVEGSHRIKRHIRGSAYLFPDYSAFYPELEQAATSISLKAGEAIIFYVNIIHGSPPNYGENERIATCFSVIPKEAPLTIYFQKQAGDPLEIHRPVDDFMYHYKHLRSETFQRPPSENPVAVKEPFINNPVKMEELMPFLPTKWSFIKRIFRSFSFG